MFVVGEDNTRPASELCIDFVRAFPEVSSVYYLINTKMNDSYADLTPVHVAGSITIEENLDGLRFAIGPQTFFQVNSAQTEVMYRRIMETAKVDAKDTVWDLYCGVGTISSYAARICKSVVGVEYVEAAVNYAKETCAINGISNARFFAGDMKDLLDANFLRTHGVPDLVITDPPRAGMHAAACETLSKSGAKRIMYVSCKPESLTRDLAILSGNYRLLSVQAVDLMPQSSHVETLAYMELR
jgi:23S rRNA (uracil1939-C5)-methyltransferase